jgi:NAD(P)H-dependent flavin oxidoreductase YrpB (nitropropane dioxygenase family)
MDAFLRKLGIGLPIIQTPMAGVSTPEVAAAVSNAGGLGSIGVGSVDAEATRQMIAAVGTGVILCCRRRWQTISKRSSNRASRPG